MDYKAQNSVFLVRSALRGSLDLEQKSLADEREVYGGDTERGNDDRKRAKKGRNSENFNLRKIKMAKI